MILFVIIGFRAPLVFIFPVLYLLKRYVLLDIEDVILSFDIFQSFRGRHLLLFMLTLTSKKIFAYKTMESYKKAMNVNL
jgi:hypothetical protein